MSKRARERVLAAAAELRYRPNLLARNARSGTTTTIGVVVADISNPFFSHSTRGIADEAHRNGFEIMVVNTDEDFGAERAAVQLLLSQRVAGLIVAPADRSKGEHLEEAQQGGTPVVLLDRRVRNVEADRVYADNVTGAAAAMADLISAGHERIGYVSCAAGPGGWPTGMPVPLGDLVTSAGDRIQSYVATLESEGHAPFEYLSLCAFGDAAAYDACAELLARPRRPSAIFASDGVIALSVLRAIQDAGLHVPEEVAVVAGDQPDWAAIVTPGLSAVRQPVAQLGLQAVQLLIERIAAPERPYRDVILPTRYERRGSTAGPVRDK